MRVHCSISTTLSRQPGRFLPAYCLFRFKLLLSTNLCQPADVLGDVMELSVCRRLRDECVKCLTKRSGPRGRINYEDKGLDCRKLCGASSTGSVSRTGWCCSVVV